MLSFKRHRNDRLRVFYENPNSPSVIEEQKVYAAQVWLQNHKGVDCNYYGGNCSSVVFWLRNGDGFENSLWYEFRGKKKL